MRGRLQQAFSLILGKLLIFLLLKSPFKSQLLFHVGAGQIIILGGDSDLTLETYEKF